MNALWPSGTAEHSSSSGRAAAESNIQEIPALQQVPGQTGLDVQCDTGAAAVDVCTSDSIAGLSEQSVQSSSKASSRSLSH